MLGRTGNNLFQYAAGRALAEKHRTELVMDGSWFRRSDWESVRMIENLPIKARLTRSCPVASKALKRITGRHHFEFFTKSIHREPPEDTSFDPDVLMLPDNTVLFGYFQTPFYFHNIEGEIRKDLSFESRKLDNESQLIAASLSKEHSVAVHVRRTDYIGNSNTEVCGSDYYRNCFSRFRELYREASFYLFSDDPDWCRNHFSESGVSVIDCRASNFDPLNDLHLMSLAHHHIIANSSYSWWGAWLGNKPGQKVLMPDQWFRGIASPIDEKRYEGWETVPTG